MFKQSPKSFLCISFLFSLAGFSQVSFLPATYYLNSTPKTDHISSQSCFHLHTWFCHRNFYTLIVLLSPVLMAFPSPLQLKVFQLLKKIILIYHCAVNIFLQARLGLCGLSYKVLLFLLAFQIKVVKLRRWVSKRENEDRL